MRHSVFKYTGRSFYGNYIKRLYCMALVFIISTNLYAQSPGGVTGGIKNGILYEFYGSYNSSLQYGITTGNLWSWGYIDNFKNADDIFINEKSNEFALALKTSLNITVAGDYTFRFDALDDLGAIIIDGTLYLGEVCCGTQTGTPITLSVGFHSLEVYFSENAGSEHLDLVWDLPGGGTSFEEIPIDQLFTNLDLSAWYKANDGAATLVNDPNGRWIDKSGNFNHLAPETGLVTYEDGQQGKLNYNPFVTFSGDVMSRGDHVLGFSWNKQSRTSFIVSSGMETGFKVMMGYGNNSSNQNYYVGSSNQGLIVGGANNSTVGAGFQYSNEGTYLTRARYVNSSILGTNNLTGAINGMSNITTTKLTLSTRFTANSDFTLGNAPNYPAANIVATDIAEVIQFPWELDSIEIDKVESYLAIKYGITLDQSTPRDYIASDGSVFWSAANNVGYSNDIFGIGRDTSSALDQRISTSSNSRTVLGVALDHDFTSSNNDVTRTTTHTNTLQYLMFSDNGEGLVANQSYEIPTGNLYNYRVPREWHVSKTANFGQAVNLKFNGFGSDATQQYLLFKDSDGDFSTGAVEIGALDASGEITGVTLNDGEYLALVLTYRPVPVGLIGGLRNGLYFEFYDAYDGNLNNGISGDLLSYGYISNLNKTEETFINEKADEFSLKITSDLNITTAGDYIFRFNQIDDNGSLYIDGVNYLEVCCGFTTAGTPITLSVGYHSIEVRYSEYTGNQNLDVEWDLPGGGTTFVEIPDDQFFVFVSPSVWYKANDGVSSTINTGGAWLDKSGNSNDLLELVGPVVYEDGQPGELNYNPFVKFTSNDLSSGDHVQGLGWDKHSRTSFIVSSKTATGSNILMGYGSPSTNNNYYVRVYNQNLILGGRGNFSTGADVPYAQDIPSITRTTYVNSNIQGTSNLTGYINGWPNIEDDDATLTPRLSSGDDFTLGNAPGYGASDLTIANIAEVIHFPWELDSTEIDKVESYLAIKYGISLDQSTLRDYIASDGTVFWSAADNVGYTYDIFGIGRDAISVLDQRISSSSNDRTVLTVALDNDFTSSNNDLTRTTTHTNTLQYLMFSNNGGGLVANQSYELPIGTSYNYRVAREWRVSKMANFGQAVNLKFNGFGSDASLQYILFKDSDGDFNTGAVEVGALDANGEITGVTLNDGEYFTLVTYRTAPGGIAGGLKNGLYFEFYNAFDGNLNDGISGELTSSGYLSNLDNVETTFIYEKADEFSLKITSDLNITTSGDYTFRFNQVDDYASLYIDGVKYLEVCCGFTTAGNPITLSVGYHSIEVRYSEYGGNQNLDVEWDLPGGGTTFVEIPDDQFFVPVSASIWYKADEGIFSVPNGSGLETIATWSDQSGNFNTLSNVSGQTMYSEETGVLNYNPFVQFSGSEMSPGNTTDGFGWQRQSRTSFIVSSEPTTGLDLMMGYGRAATNKNYFVGSNNHELIIGSTSNSPNGTGTPYGNPGTYLTQVKYVNSEFLGTNNLTGGINGLSNITATNLNLSTELGASFDFELGNAPGYSIGNAVTSNIAEVIHFPWELDTTEIDKVESYLAVKYGIALDQSTPRDYISSDGSIFWNAANNVGYTNNIFGIGRDSLSVLDQKISHAADKERIVVMALDNDFITSNVDIARSTLHANNNQFLMLGSNGESAIKKQFSELPPAPTSYEARIAREWKVSKTANFGQSVSLKFNSFYSIGSIKYVLMKDSDGDFTAGATQVGVLDGKGEISGVTLADGEYLTLFIITHTPGAVKGGLRNGVSFEFYSDFDPVLSDGISGTLINTGYISNLNNVHEIFQIELSDRFTLRLNSELNIITAGDYTFRFNSLDDYGAIFIDGILYLGDVCCGTNTGTPITLSAGYHSIEVRFSENTGNQNLDVVWDLPGGGTTFVEIPDSQLFTELFMSSWYKSDAGIQDDSGAVLTSWIDNSINNDALTVSVGTPIYYSGIEGSRIMNFNPIIACDDARITSQDHIDGLPWGQQSRTVFTVSSHSNNSEGYIMGYGEGSINNSNFSVGLTVYNLSVNFRNDAFLGTGIPFLDQGTKLSSVQYVNSNLQGVDNVLGRLNGANTITGTKLNANTKVNNGHDFQIGNTPDNGDAEGFNGWIGEIVCYPWELSTDEVDRVETYLGVKYGITLDQTIARNYVASDGSVVWNAANNVGYNNDIFGVGRDSLSVLDQRISQSDNVDDSLIVSLNDDFTSPNIDTSRTKHANFSQYFLLSNNDGSKTTDQTTEMPTVTINDYDFRMAREWKVSKTANFTQTVNLKFEGFGSSNINKNYLLKDSDGDFTNGATEVGLLNGSGEITGVTLEDGEYLTIVNYKASPGGVFNDLQIWTMANHNGAASDIDFEPLETDGATMDLGWTNWYGDDFVKSVEPSIGVPTYESDSASQMNFNPTINFDGTSYFSNYTSNFGLTGLESHVYSVVRSLNSTAASPQSNGIFGPNSVTYSNAMEIDVYKLNGEYLLRRYNQSGDLVNANIDVSKGNILGGSRNSTGLGTAYINGNSTDMNSNLIPWNSVARYGIGGSVAGVLNGKMPEVIGYNRKLSVAEINKVESYLSIKYGVPLKDLSAIGQTDQYFASDGTVVWDGALASTGYIENVFGIGRDDRSALNQTISKSFVDSTVLIMSIEDNYTLMNSERSDTTITTNLNFVMMASNADPLAWQTTEICPCEGHARVGKEWQMQVTGTDINDIYLAVHKDNLPTYPSNVGFYILESDDGDFSQGNILSYEMDLNGNYYRVKVPVKNGTYFTLAYVSKNNRLRNGKKFIFGKLVYPTTK